ncbi:MAG TPA: Uma2 family endonuclease [Pirellulaceae bacterium]|nr:Uma2 family endonuclease [Pirellulaceae bacterium]
MSRAVSIDPKAAPGLEIPPLVAGDHLTRAEFERRYRAMPHLKKAELIEGIVYMPSPVSHDDHGAPHFDLITWAGIYRAFTPGVQGGDNSTLHLDLDNEAQPDAHLRILPECGGQSRTVGGYVERAPELVAEVSASSASYDLHEKLKAYRRNGVREYVVWRVWDKSIDWFALRAGQFEPLPPDAAGIFRSECFPGLWLDAAALLRGDLARVVQVVQQGVATPEHSAFVARLAAARRSGEQPA